MDEIQNDTKSSSGNLWLWMTLLPILYVLSIGPVAKSLSVMGASSEVINVAKAFYWPLIWLHENTFLKELLEAYMKLWGL